MKIDSSYIGMESGRTYQSRTTGKLSYRVQMGSTNNDEQVNSEWNNNEDVLNEEQTQELADAQGKLKQMGGIRKIPSVSRVEENNPLEDIRQQCILYLWTIFFGESRANEMADTMGIRPSSNNSLGKQSGAWNQTNSWSHVGTLMAGEVQKLQGFGASSFTITAERETVYMESENTSFSTTGTVKTADGREISFNLDVAMSRKFARYTKETVQNVASFVDPLVINLNGNIAEVSDQKFYFDLDADGEEEAISRLCEDSGYLALDSNQDGKINDGSELFGTKSGDGFEDLSVYDEDGNGWIDENDDVWNKLKIWVQDEEGNSRLYSLAEQGVGAICLQNVSTEFEQRGNSGEVNAAIRNTGIFLYENGAAGTIQHLDLVKNKIAQYA